jgi:hypothetical protein
MNASVMDDSGYGDIFDSFHSKEKESRIKWMFEGNTMYDSLAIACIAGWGAEPSLLCRLVDLHQLFSVGDQVFVWRMDTLSVEIAVTGELTRGAGSKFAKVFPWKNCFSNWSVRCLRQLVCLASLDQGLFGIS